MDIAQSDFSEQVGYTPCDREKIHLLGHIQPHGILIAIKELELEIVQISENTIHFFGIAANSLVNKPLRTLFPQSQIETLLPLLSQQDLETFNPVRLTAEVENKKYQFEGEIYRSGGLLILELEPLFTDSKHSLGFYHLAKVATTNVRKAQDFSEVSNLLVQEIRRITEYDRALIYKFDPDGNGVVIAEAKSEYLEPLLGLHYPASDIPSLTRELYHKKRLRLIVDVNHQFVPIIPSNNPLTKEPLDLSLSSLRSISLFHVRYLQKMKVAASLAIALINEDKLWGLIVCHHSIPKYIDYETRKTCEFLGQIMSIEIVSKHETQLKKSQEKIKDIQAKLRQNVLDSNQSISQAPIQNVSIQDVLTQDVDSLLNLVNAQGVVICLGDRVSTIGQCPSQAFISSLITWIQAKSQDIFYTNHLSQSYSEAIEIKDIASGLLAISISINHTSYHVIWFRTEVIQTVNWAGDPSKLLDIDMDDSSDDLSPSPQRSFELWKETVKAKSLDWGKVEIESALELRGTLILAALEFSQQALKQEAERSEVANQAKSSFLARMSHELRTPLNAILGCTQLMHDDDCLTHDLAEYVNIISHSSEHLLNLIDDVLEMSKIEAGKIILEETKFDFYLFLNNLQEMFQIRAKDKKLQLIFAVHPDLPQYIKSDERKIRQILLNLLGNAIKFTDKGYVALRVSLLKTESISSKVIIHFEIEDTGRGIAPEEIDKLFKAFVQTTSGKESQTGTGLGLVISQQFAHFMGGHIMVSSALDKGTIFQFDIAVEQLFAELIAIGGATNTAKTSIAVVEKESQLDNSQSLRILLAEDNSFNQMIALRLLAKLGYQADCAVNGVEVLRILEHKSYDLILMDLQMPEMDGLEATRRIRLIEADLSSNRIKIVAMTANAMAEDREKCLLVGMDGFISKPVRIDALTAVLNVFKRQELLCD